MDKSCIVRDAKTNVETDQRKIAKTFWSDLLRAKLLNKLAVLHFSPCIQQLAAYVVPIKEICPEINSLAISKRLRPVFP